MKRLKICFLIILIFGVPSVSIGTLKWIRNDVHVFQLLNLPIVPYVVAVVIGFVRAFDITLSVLFVTGIVTYIPLLHKSLHEMQ